MATINPYTMSPGPQGHSDVSVNPYASGVSVDPYASGVATQATNAPVRKATDLSVILERAKPNLYQTSSIVSLVKLQKAPNEDALKEELREKMNDQMRVNLIQNLVFTRVDNRHDDTLTIHARCYVFTREQLIEFALNIIGH